MLSCPVIVTQALQYFSVLCVVMSCDSDTGAAMQYLEVKRLVHRDLAARNVLVHDDGKAKACLLILF